ncbi:MAG: phosphoribosylformimino-5-aminoimidazole carboxamide ribotide isomerase [Chitinivibrionales bacterium]|nr:phosphoribosylformimino-5-aminoimidazole carboxamide ribotide isomerase [Chitinivibrionales bacterium]
MNFRPCIDIHQGAVKQIVGGTLSDSDSGSLVTNFESKKPPSYYAGLYRGDTLYGGHVIMLGPGNEKAACEALSAFPRGLQAGGGIRPDNAAAFLDAGASHVIVTSYIFDDKAISRSKLHKMVAAVGKKRLVIDLSCKKTNNRYVVVTRRWQDRTSVELTKETLEFLAEYCDEFLVHAADVEGRRAGVEHGLVKLLGSFSPIPVTYAGGIRSIDDMDRICTEGAGRVDATIGSALDIFGGTVSYRKVVEWHNAHSARPAE